MLFRSLEQDAERDFGIRLSERSKTPPFFGVAGFNVIKAAVMRKDVHATAKLTDEWLGIGEGNAALGRVANVRNEEAGGQSPFFDKA